MNKEINEYNLRNRPMSFSGIPTQIKEFFSTRHDAKNERAKEALELRRRQAAESKYKKDQLSLADSLLNLQGTILAFSSIEHYQGRGAIEMLLPSGRVSLQRGTIINPGSLACEAYDQQGRLIASNMLETTVPASEARDLILQLRREVRSEYERITEDNKRKVKAHLRQNLTRQILKPTP